MDKFLAMAQSAKKWSLWATIMYFLLGVFSLFGYEQPGDLLSVFVYLGLGLLMLSFFLSISKSITEDSLEQFEHACHQQGQFVQVSGFFFLGILVIGILVAIGIGLTS